MDARPESIRSDDTHAAPGPGPEVPAGDGPGLAAAALDVLHDAVLLIEPDGLRIRWANRAAARCLGLPAAAIPGRTLPEVEPDFAREAFAELVRSLRDGRASAVRVRTRHRQGAEVVPVEVQLQLLPADDGPLLLATVRDRRHEEALEQEREALAHRLSTATIAAGIGVWSWDIGSGDVTWDETMFQLFDVDDPGGPRVVPFETWRSRVVEGDRAPAVNELQRSVERGCPFRTSFRIRHRDGSIRHIRAEAVPVLDATGRPVRMVGVNVDETERIEAEQARARALDEAERANRAKTDFLANMSHEIRTPMTAILGFGELLAGPEGGDPERRAELVATIRRNGEHLVELLNDILDVSRIERDRLELARVPLDPAALVEEVAGMLRPQAEQRGIDLLAHVASAPPGPVLGDPLRLRQIVTNLVANAVKFTDAGLVTVEMEWEPGPDDPAAGTLVVEVRDTGIGMTARELARAFEPFAQADDGASRRHGGLGIGLALARRLARLMGGDIEAESEPGHGSTFTVRVRGEPAPADAADDAGPAEVPPAASPADPERPLAGRRILLAEDGPDNRRLIGHLLRRLGAEVELAEDGLLAVAAWQAARDDFDLVLMDMQMPRMDGYEASRRLRELGCSAPVVALTAHAMTGDRERCLAAGCSGYLTKPIDRQRLRDGCLEALAVTTA